MWGWCPVLQSLQSFQLITLSFKTVHIVEQWASYWDNETLGRAAGGVAIEKKSNANVAKIPWVGVEKESEGKEYPRE